MVGLNFADEKEASKFNMAVESKLQERERKTSEFDCLVQAAACIVIVSLL